MSIQKMILIGILSPFISLLTINAQASPPLLDSLSYEELDSLKNVHNNQGAYEKALIYAHQGVTKAKAEFGAKHATYINYINNLAILHQTYGNYEKAEPYYWEVKEIFQEVWGKNNAQYIATISNLATLQDYMGKYKKAESLHLQVLDLEEKFSGKKSINYLVYLNSLAFSYYYADKQAYAIPIFTKVSSLCKEILGEAHPYYPTTLVNLASSYKINKDYHHAEQLFLQALTIEEQILSKTDPSYAISLNNVASLYHDIGKYRKAERLYLQAIEILKNKSMTKTLNYLNYINNIAELYIDLKDFDQATHYLNQSFSLNLLSDNTKIPNLIEMPKNILDYEFKFEQKIIPTLHLVYQLSRSQYDNSKISAHLEQAYAALSTAMTVSRNIRNSFMDDQDKLSNIKQMSSLSKDAIETTTLLSKIGGQHYLLEAFKFAEQNKSMLLIDALQGNRARTLGDLPDSLALLELDLQRQKTELKKQKYEATSRSTHKKIIAEENELNKKINAFLSSIKDKYPKYHALKYQSTIPNTTEVQALLDKGTMLLQYFIADSMSYLFTVTNKGIDLYPLLVSKDSLTIQIQKLRQALSDYNFVTNSTRKNQEQYMATAYWFYKTILAAALKNKCNIKNLVIVTDGELGHLPFGAFLTEPISQAATNYRNLPYLLRRYNISYDYSATLWKENRTKSTAKNNHQILAFAPAYTNTTDSSLILTRSPYAHSIRSALATLPATQHELTALSKIIDGTYLRNDSANEASFKQMASEYGILHLAMHGVINNRLSMLSALVFSETSDSLEDGLLQAYEIARLKVNADLVVLSACETGYGKYKQGEGIMSLARSFMYAGASSLIVSLWQVNDEATSIIITDFYKNLTQGMPKDKALRIAKLNFINQSSDLTAHPVFWSPFIQIGDNRSIPSITQFDYVKGAFIGGSLLLILAGLFFAIKKLIYQPK
ncbi:CHAT domain-containing protein [Aureispira anguillae]|uniref:CHAT domain-containing protein n=1 Tax=Aureispira anguillae TaxID=2864201 RepID=A0A916DWU2_9BACT|nr:CHAT domain-containing tetratricopeptide repeat protein [Aureispira anguillae]BDS15192.1 CHAT domain-containing protein [Aureispira anguillae]